MGGGVLRFTMGVYYTANRNGTEDPLVIDAQKHARCPLIVTTKQHEHGTKYAPDSYPYSVSHLTKWEYTGDIFCQYFLASIQGTTLRK